MPGVEVTVVHVDKLGYRVAGGSRVFDEAGLARAVVALARGMVAVSRALGMPAGSVKIDWDGATMVVGVKNGEVYAVLVSSGGVEAPGTIAGRAKATV